MRALHILFLTMVICLLCPERAAGWYGWRPRNWRPRPVVKYTIRNKLKEPTFEASIDLTLLRGQPFIRYMERAANQNSTFRFSADYFNRELGYFITKINNVAANFALDESFWAFLSAPNTFLNKGVSNFYPHAGDHIIFNLTTGGHS